MKVTITLQVELEVDGEFIPGDKAYTDGPADNWDPGEPDDYQVESVTFPSGQPVSKEFVEMFIDDIQEAALDAASRKYW